LENRGQTIGELKKTYDYHYYASVTRASISHAVDERCLPLQNHGSCPKGFLLEICGAGDYCALNID